MSRHVIPGDGTLDIGVDLNGPMGKTLRRHALKRGIRVDVLIALIVQVVLRENLVDAIIDDGK